VPSGDIHTEEERRLFYVALTRARERLVVTTVAGPAAEKDPSPFLADLQEGAGPELLVVDAVTEPSPDVEGPEDVSPRPGEIAEPSEASGLMPAPRVMPVPTIRERRLALRRRATELLGLLEAIDPADPEAWAARERLTADFAALAGRATGMADEARAHGLDPLTMRVVALDSAAGANLLDVAPLPRTFSYSQVDTYWRCPLQYALQKVYAIPSGRTSGALSFGSTAHAAFEVYTRERRERLARGEPPPSREDLQRWFEAEWRSGEFEGATTEQHYRGRVGPLLDAFWTGELATLGQAEAEELPFQLRIEVPGGAPAVFTGSIDRVDRLPSGGIEVIDYKTGRVSSQKSVEENLQLSIYALACRDALRLGTPERVTLSFTETGTRMSTTRSDEQLDAARDQLAAWVARVRTGDFAATPGSDACRRCDYGALCPARVR
jgi:DNA helicase-2/ATP-dependent DNA helicase PcrA